MKSEKRQPKTDLQCAYCDKEFKYASERKRHEQSHSPQFECKVCSKKFSFLSALRRHEKQHERKGNVVCNECNRKFRDESLLQRHIKYAHEGSYTCEKCEVTFSSELALRSHAKTHRPIEQRKYHCSFPGCSKSFNFSHHLKNHEPTHTDMKQHYCNVCGKGFIQAHHLKSHKKKHEPENWLICGIHGCRKTFLNEYARKKHIATHNTKTEPKDDTTQSNSSCDITELIEPDTVKCATCKQIILRQDYDEHTKICVATNEVILEENAPKEYKVLTKLEPVKIDLNDDIRTCESFVGGCILRADKNGQDKCLCLQVSAALPTEDICELNATAYNNSKVFNNSETKMNSDVLENVCEGCECASSFKSESVSIDSKKNVSSVGEMKEIVEYREDGTVRIKEMFDLDPCDREYEELVPYSCKAVLGNCIVSGNGTIGEGCLCAKMAVDDQPMNQEIEEITPRPRTG